MKIKKGDKIQVLTGKDKGKTGTVSNILPKAGKIVVEGINMLTKHQKPRKEGEKGTKVQFASAINASNVIVICPKCNKSTRVGLIKNEGRQKLRVCKKCKATF